MKNQDEKQAIAFHLILPMRNLQHSSEITAAVFQTVVLILAAYITTDNDFL